MPEPRPCRLLARNSLVGAARGVYAELLPDAGYVLCGTGGYDYVGGRFRMRGTDRAEVKRSVHTAATAYDLVVEAAP